MTESVKSEGFEQDGGQNEKGLKSSEVDFSESIKALIVETVDSDAFWLSLQEGEEIAKVCNDRIGLIRGSVATAVKNNLRMRSAFQSMSDVESFFQSMDEALNLLGSLTGDNEQSGCERQVMAAIHGRVLVLLENSQQSELPDQESVLEGVDGLDEKLKIYLEIEAERIIHNYQDSGDKERLENVFQQVQSVLDEMGPLASIDDVETAFDCAKEVVEAKLREEGADADFFINILNNVVKKISAMVVLGEKFNIVVSPLSVDEISQLKEQMSNALDFVPPEDFTTVYSLLSFNVHKFMNMVLVVLVSVLSYEDLRPSLKNKFAVLLKGFSEEKYILSEAKFIMTLVQGVLLNFLAVYQQQESLGDGIKVLLSLGKSKYVDSLALIFWSQLVKMEVERTEYVSELMTELPLFSNYEPDLEALKKEYLEYCDSVTWQPAVQKNPKVMKNLMAVRLHSSMTSEFQNLLNSLAYELHDVEEWEASALRAVKDKLHGGLAEIDKLIRFEEVQEAGEEEIDGMPDEEHSLLEEDLSWKDLRKQLLDKHGWVGSIEIVPATNTDIADLQQRYETKYRELEEHFEDEDLLAINVSLNSVVNSVASMSAAVLEGSGHLFLVNDKREKKVLLSDLDNVLFDIVSEAMDSIIRYKSNSGFSPKAFLDRYERKLLTHKIATVLKLFSKEDALKLERMGLISKLVKGVQNEHLSLYQRYQGRIDVFHGNVDLSKLEAGFFAIHGLTIVASLFGASLDEIDRSCPNARSIIVPQSTEDVISKDMDQVNELGGHGESSRVKESNDRKIESLKKGYQFAYFVSELSEELELELGETFTKTLHRFHSQIDSEKQRKKLDVYLGYIWKMSIQACAQRLQEIFEGPVNDVGPDIIGIKHYAIALRTQMEGAYLDLGYLCSEFVTLFEIAAEWLVYQEKKGSLSVESFYNYLNSSVAGRVERIYTILLSRSLNG